MTASGLPANTSGLFVEPREDWLALQQEEIIDPARPIVDPHHHLWNRGHRYLIEEMAADIGSGHNIIATVYVDCRSMYRAHGPEAFRPVGEDRKSTRLNSSHVKSSYAVFCLKKKK